MFRKAHLIPLAAFVLVAAAPPAAASAGAAERQMVTTSQSGGSEAKAERKICRTIPDSARRTDNKRLCMTQAQWEKFDDEMDD